MTDDVDRLLARLGSDSAADRLEAQVALLPMGASIVPGLARLLGGDNPHACREAVWLLAHLLDVAAPARPEIEAALCADDPYVKVWAAEAIRRLDDPDVAEREILDTITGLLARLADGADPASDGNVGSQ